MVVKTKTVIITALILGFSVMVVAYANTTYSNAAYSNPILAKKNFAQRASSYTGYYVCYYPVRRYYRRYPETRYYNRWPSRIVQRYYSGTYYWPSYRGCHISKRSCRYGRYYYFGRYLSLWRAQRALYYCRSYY